MSKRTIKLAACAAAVVLASLTAPVHGGTLEKTMYLTFSGPVRLPGVTLAAGTYEFEIANPLTAPTSSASEAATAGTRTSRGSPRRCRSRLR